MAYITLLILLAGMLMYLLCSNAKAQELGRIMFFCALIALTIVVFAPKTAHLFH